MEALPALIFHGITMGLIYILVGLGLTLVFSIANIVNFAHGVIYMLGAYILYYTFAQWGLPYPLGIILAMLGTGALGMLIQRFLYSPLRGKFLESAIVGFGLLMAMEQGGFVVFGQYPRATPRVVQGALNIGSISYPLEIVVTALISVALVIALYLFVQRSKMGQAMQAAAQDNETASLQGVDIKRMALLAMGIGSALAGAAGALIAPVYGVIYSMGTMPLNKALIIIAIGGMGSIPGVIVAGLMLGLVDSIGVGLAGGIGDLFGFVLLILVLMIRPKGLLGHE